MNVLIENTIRHIDLVVYTYSNDKFNTPFITLLNDGYTVSDIVEDIIKEGMTDRSPYEDLYFFITGNIVDRYANDWIGRTSETNIPTQVEIREAYYKFLAEWWYLHFKRAFGNGNRWNSPIVDYFKVNYLRDVDIFMARYPDESQESWVSRSKNAELHYDDESESWKMITHSPSNYYVVAQFTDRKGATFKVFTKRSDIFLASLMQSVTSGEGSNLGSLYTVEFGDKYELNKHVQAMKALLQSGSHPSIRKLSDRQPFYLCTGDN